VIVPQQTKAPESRQELNTLHARQSELQSQIEALTDRRGSLAQQRLNAQARVEAGAIQDRQLVQEYNAQIDEIGARLTRLNRELNQVNDAILVGVSRGVGSGSRIGSPAVEAIPVVPPIPPIHIGRFNEANLHRQYMGMMLAEAVFFILLGVVGWRLMVRRLRRDAIPAAPAQDVAQLRDAVDAIALEVERISEGQRYVTKLLSERGDKTGQKPGA
jgi:hypothetical protein